MARQSASSRRLLRPARAGVLAGSVLALVALAPAAPGARMAAQALFQTSCAPCHGAGGEGGIGPQLAGRQLTAEAVATHVRQGGLVMPAFPASRISDQELQQLVTYVGGLATPPATALLPAPAASAPGAAPFQARCLMCHGAEARGGIGPGILNTSLTLPQFMNQLRHGGGLMPPFAADQVSAAQAAQIYAYLHPPLRRPDAGAVYTLPAMPDYVSDFLFTLAALALVAQVGSERRRRVHLAVRSEAERVSAQMPQDAAGRLQIQVF